MTWSQRGINVGHEYLRGFVDWSSSAALLHARRFSFHKIRETVSSHVLDQRLGSAQLAHDRPQVMRRQRRGGQRRDPHVPGPVRVEPDVPRSPPVY
jgi:hypothetical protein